MNKKLSLMMAAILAAGYSVTAEAGVYKVSSLTTGGTYVIALDGLTLDGSVKALTSDGGFESKGITAITDAELWTLSAATGGTIANVATTTEITQVSGVASLSGSGVTFTSIAPLKTATSSFTDFQITTGTPAFGNDNGDAELYVVGTPIFTSETLTKKYLKIGDKYLVATAADAATLVDAALISLYDTDAALWTATDAGVISNPKTGAEITGIAGSGASVTVAATGGKAIEKDANNTNTNVYVEGTDAAVSGLSNATILAKDAAGLAVDVVSDTHTNADAVSFATGKISYLGVYASSNNEYVTITKGVVGVTADQTKPGVANGITVKEVRKDVYSFYNDGNLVAFAGAGAEFKIIFVEGSESVFYLQSASDPSKYLKNDLTLDAIADAAQFCLVAGEQVDLTAETLAAIEKDGFTVTIKYGDNKTDLTGNPFKGHLVVEGTGNDFTLKSGDNNVVGVVNGIEGSTAYDNAYTFKTVSDKELADNPAKYETTFNATRSEFDDAPTEIVLTLNSTKIGYVEVNGTKILAAHANAKDVVFSMGSTSVVKASDLLTDKFFRVVKIDKKNGNKVLGVQYDNAATGTLYGEAAWVSDINGDLEDQWALTLTDNDTKYTFTNRETKEITFTLTASQLYYGEEEGEYVSGSDTYSITPIENTKSEDGYLRLENVKNKRFNLGYWSDTYNAAAWFTENHKDVKKDNHVIGLDQENDPLVLAVVDFVGAKDTKKSIKSDSIYVVSELGYFDAKGEYQKRLDTLKVVAYSFINQYNEPMKLATKVVNNEDAYVSVATPKYETLAEAIEAVREGDVAQKFTLRKVGDKLNLRPVEFAEATGLYHKFSTNDVNKMYSGDTKNGILYNTEMYSRPENDRFVIEESNKPMYRTVTNELDTIAIYRQDNPADMMFEKGQFLGIANNVQFDKIAPAMVAELAYVDGEGHHPQYMLLVEPGIVEGGTWCPEHGLNSGCPHAEPFDGYTTGRYLVNLKDTAIVWNTDNHMKGNPYVNSENYYKLGFVQASHIGDSLIFNAVEPTAVDTVKMNTADYNVAKFSFRYVDNDEKSFVIETADYEKLNDAKEGEVKPTYGYLKWMNDVVVVVSDIKDADVFNMDEEYAGNPTANEGINASSVSVIAGNGVVTINGAAGKKVVISNVLGQTIANTVLSSDNATISAPAGVVVVAVEGEAAVKAIVK